MRLYGAIQKVEPQDDGTVRVYGIATSEAVDEQGEVVRADAIRAAIPEYMRFPALREMHQLSAAGTTLEAEVGEDGTTRIVAHVVDPVAVSKVRNQVYRGFSIGGRVTQREAGSPKTITGLVLTEISLVDRPANPEAIFDCWKAAIASVAPHGIVERVFAIDSPADSAPISSEPEPFNAPIQIWSCGVSAHRHLAKVEALKCMRAVGPPRAIAAGNDGAEPETKSHGNCNSPVLEDCDRNARVCLAKSIGEPGQIAPLITELQRLREALALRASPGNDQPAPARRMQEIIGELCDLLCSLTSQEVGDAEGEMQTDDPSPGSATFGMRGKGTPATDRLPALRADPQMFDGGVTKTKYSRADQALLDMAHSACDQCLKIDGLSIDEKANIEQARNNLRQAGAIPDGVWAVERAEHDDDSAIPPDCPTLDGSEIDTVEEPGVLIERMSKRDRSHQNLMDLAHECLEAMTGGGVCEPTAKIGRRHLQENFDLFRASHAHLLAAGARCDRPTVAATYPTAQIASDSETEMAAKSAATVGEPSEKAALTKVLGEIVPMIERLSRRVDEIARTPLPPLTIAKGTVAISKQQDRESDVAGREPDLSREAVAAALAKMSKEEQTLTLIKASYATPIRIPGSAPDPG